MSAARLHGLAGLRGVAPAALVALLAACGGAGDDGEAGLPDGFWYPAAEDGGAIARPLDGLGYADGFEAPRGDGGAVTLDASRVAPGFNLYTSGHAAEAFLVDRAGVVAHTWALPHAGIPGAPPLDHPTQAGWRRARLLPGGALLALHDGVMLVKVSRDSELVWWSGDRAHHDLDVAPDGTIVALTRRVANVEWVSSEARVLDESVAFLSPGGETLRSIPILEALRDTRWAPSVRAAAADPARVRIEIDGREALDVLHANSVRVLEGGPLADRDPAFAAGNVLLCLRELNVLCVLDPAEERIVWLRTGPWLAPHDPRITPSGTVTLFDNLGRPGGTARVLEIDPVGGEVLWSFPGPGSEAALRSPVCGAARRLANGNTLVTESTRGRALEISPEGEVVWAFVSPHRVGADGGLVAVLFEVERVPSERLEPWRGGMNGELARRR